MSAIRALVEDIRNIDTRSVSQEDVERRVRELIYYYPVRVGQISLAREGLWRARKGPRNQFYMNVRSLWYPPAIATPLGRLNAAGEPVFYCTPRRGIAGLETRPTSDEWVSVVAAEARPGKEILQIYPLGLDRCGDEVRRHYGYQWLGSDPAFRKFLGSDASFDKWRLIDGLLSDLLSENVAKDQEHKYKRTLAIRKLFDRMPHQGYMYPSIATKLFGVNLCLPTSVVDDCLTAVGAHVFELEDGRDARELRRARPVVTSSGIAVDGSIAWQQASRDQVPPKTRWWHLEGGERLP